MKKNCFTMFDESGEEIVYDVLFAFDSEETGKNYIVYTDNTKDSAGNIQVYASIRVKEGNRERLEAIETEKEWKMIDIILEELQKEVRKKKASADPVREAQEKINRRFEEEFRMFDDEEDIPF